MGRTIIPLILLIAAAGTFMVYTNGAYQDSKALAAQYQQYNDALTQSSQLRGLRDQLLSRRNTFSADDVRKVERLLPDNVDNIRLIIDINDIAARYHLQVSNVSFQAAQTAQGSVGSGSSVLGTATVTFAISATYDQFMTFIQDLERSLRLLDIENVSFTVGAGDITDYTITVQTYWLR